MHPGYLPPDCVRERACVLCVWVSLSVFVPSSTTNKKQPWSWARSQEFSSSIPRSHCSQPTEHPGRFPPTFCRVCPPFPSLPRPIDGRALSLPARSRTKNPHLNFGCCSQQQNPPTTSTTTPPPPPLAYPCPGAGDTLLCLSCTPSLGIAVPRRPAVLPSTRVASPDHGVKAPRHPPSALDSPGCRQ